ncbi:MAG TPA: TonB-dependent receptor [Pseudomonadales bacterium]
MRSNDGRIGEGSSLAASGAMLATVLVTGFAAPAAAGQPGTRAVIEEVVVTARKREERLIDTPVSVSALGREEVERYHTRDLAQLTTRMPGVQIGHAAGGGNGGAIFIRNVGSLAVDYGADQPVSLVLDGMSFTRGHVLDVGFFDVAAVEVLKGPQALFFGKNSPAGVIAVTSVTPEIGAPLEGFLTGSYEFETEDPVIEAALSVPVGDHLAFRLAARAQDMQGGYLENSARPIDPNPLYYDALPTRGASYDEFPEQKQSVVRFTGVWQPVDNFDAILKIFRSYTRQNDAGLTVLYACAAGVGGQPTFAGVVPDPTQTCTSGPRLKRNGALPPAAVADAHPNIDADSRFFNRMTNEIQTLELNWNLGAFTLTSVTGHWDYRHREYTNYDYTSYAVVISKQGESGESWTEELRLSSNFDGPFNFMLGGFYEDTDRDLDAPVQILPQAFYPPGFMPNPEPGRYQGSFLNYHQRWDNAIESWSVFGSFDYRLAPRWSLSGGVRYTDEERESFGGNLYERGLGFSPGGVFYSPRGESQNTSPELTLSWHPADDLLVYAAYKTGFQSFGISNPGTVPDLSTAPQSVIDDYFVFEETEVAGFEVGLKGAWFDGRLRGDIAVYDYEYEDLQVAIFDPITTTFSTQNAAVATNRGIELQGEWQATDGLQVRVGALYTDLEFDDFEDAQCHTGQPVVSDPPGCHLLPNGATVQDLSGEKYGGPPVQINVGFTYDRPVLQDWGIELTADVIWHDEGRETRRQPNTDTPSRTISNLAARLYQQDGPWMFSLICSNCANEIYVTSIQDKPLGSVGDLTGQIGLPRLLIAQVTYRLQ